MRKPDHLTEKQLVSYSEGSLGEEEKQMVGQHLLFCAVCRDALPVISRSRFLEILMGEDNDFSQVAVTGNDKEHLSGLSVFSKLSQLIRKPPALAWSSGALLIILGLSFLIWINTATRSGQAEKEIVSIQFEEKKKNVADLSGLEADPNPDDLQQQPKSNEIPFRQRSNEARTPAGIKSKREISNKTKKIVPDNKKSLAANKVSSTRGGTDSQPKCDENEVKGNFQIDGKELVLKWKKVPNARKYHLFVSDDEEILIDEYETQDGTSYVLKKTLEPEKTYSWKILVTLENGETVIGNSQKFTVKEIKSDNFDRKEKSDIRCAEKK